MLRSLCCLVFCVLLGCTPSVPTRSEEDVAKGKQALTTALESWKKNEPEGKLEGISFSEDFRKTRSLLEFEIGSSSVPDPRTVAFQVKIKTRDKKNKEEIQTVTYLVELNQPIRVNRDPYN
jgi:hypothetical protein